MVDDCFLCRAAMGTTDIPWTDRPLWLDPRFGVLVPGLGGLSVGYVLLAPIEHHPNLAQAVASHESGAHGLLSFMVEVLEFLQVRMGPLTYWEHGAPAIRDHASSACIDHAHLHIVPGRLELPPPPDQATYRTMGAALSALAGRVDIKGSYLLTGFHPGPCSVGSDVAVSQYYRQEWAKSVGRADEWDYLLAENPANTKNTIESIFARRVR